MPERSAIIYQNASKTVTLLDIPLSIALSQGASESSRPTMIYSICPQKEPWPSNEPRSLKAKANVAAHGMKCENGSEAQHWIQHALGQLNADWEGDWCLARMNGKDFLEPTIDTNTANRTFTLGQRSESLLLRATLGYPMGPQELQTCSVQNVAGKRIDLRVKAIFDQHAPSVPTTYHIPVS